MTKGSSAPAGVLHRRGREEAAMSVLQRCSEQADAPTKHAGSHLWALTQCRHRLATARLLRNETGHQLLASYTHRLQFIYIHKLEMKTVHNYYRKSGTSSQLLSPVHVREDKTKSTKTGAETGVGWKSPRDCDICLCPAMNS